MSKISSFSVLLFQASKWAQRQRKLTLEEKVKALQMYDQNPSSRKVAEAFGVGKDQIQRLVKRKADIMNEFETNVPSDRKWKVRKKGNEDKRTDMKEVPRRNFKENHSEWTHVERTSREICHWSLHWHIHCFQWMVRIILKETQHCVWITEWWMWWCGSCHCQLLEQKVTHCVPGMRA